MGYMKPWFFNWKIKLQLILARLLARWLFWRKYFFEKYKKYLEKELKKLLRKRRKRRAKTFFKPKRPWTKRRKSFFIQATKSHWRENWRLLVLHWHKWRHQKSKVKKANQKKIARYLKEKKRLVFRKNGIRLSQIVWTIISFSLTFGIIYGSWWSYENIFHNLPLVSELIEKKQPMTTKILDRNNHLLFSIYEEENRTPISLSQVSPWVIQATVAIEDRNFYTHNGFDLKAIARAFMTNQQSGETKQGASTITQQLVKLRLLSREKTLIRKVRELVLSVLVEGNYDKNQILEMYLNEVNYGGPVYGIEQAAVTFFGKNAKDLTLAESAFLAGLPQAPSRYSPYADNLDESYARRAEVLRRMREDGFISLTQEAEANAEELVFKNSAITIEAPHFVMYVRRLLSEIYGEEMVNSGGLVVRTTLDLSLQNQTQQIVTDEVNSLARMRISNGAALVTNPNTGEILAMVGSKDYFDFANDGMVNVTLRERQPGSSIKPLTYALALENGYTPASLILDAPITYHFQGGPDYSPKNYDGKFHGQVTLRESLGSSYNIPAVKLLEQLGLNAEIDQAEAMGITTWTDRSRLGLSLTLGGGEVKMIDMAQMYGTFANGGITIEENPILEIFDYTGKSIYQNKCALFDECEGKRTLSEAASYQITNILSDNRARTPAFGPQSVLYIPGQEVAVKTGTTNNLRDNWTIGYTSDRVVAVWVGNNDNQTMSYVASGITGASPIWQKIILTQLDAEQPHTFAVPSSIEKVNYCGRDEYFRRGAVPVVVCKPAKTVDTEKSDQ